MTSTDEIVNQGKTESFAPNLPVTIKSTEAVSFHSFKEFLTISNTHTIQLEHNCMSIC